MAEADGAAATEGMGPPRPGAGGTASDIHLMQRRLEEFAREIADGGDRPGGCAAVTAGVGKPLVYAINRYCVDMDEAFSVAQLSAGLGELAAPAAPRVGAYHATVAEGVFDTAFQPIVDLDDSSTQHYGVLVRFECTKLDVSRFGFITLAEQVGLIHKFDLAMCRKVLAFLSEERNQDERYILAVNLSAGSRSVPAFASSFEALLGEYGHVRGQLTFEVT
jgi:hypothetical protein